MTHALDFYERFGVAGGIVELSNGEYIHGEREPDDTDGCMVMWSSDEQFPAFHKMLLDHYKPADFVAEVLAEHAALKHESMRFTSARELGRLSIENLNVTSCTYLIDGETITWSEPFVKLPSGRLYAEIGAVTTRQNVSRVIDLAMQTGTEDVREAAYARIHDILVTIARG